MRNRNLILGVLGVVWGAGMLISFLLRGGRVDGNGAYAAGQLAGVVLGALLLFAGAYALFKSSRM